MQEGINPNENTSATPEKIEIAGGDSPVSFDDMDTLQSSSAVFEKSESKPAESKPKQEKEEKPKVEAKEEKASKEKKEPSKDDDSQDDDETEEEAKEDKPEDKGDKKEDSTKFKTFRIKNGEDQVNLRSDSLIPVKVSGVKKTVTLQELINEYSGVKDLDTRYNEFHKKSKALESKLNVTDGLWKKFHKLSVEEKNPIAAIQLLGETSGENMIQFWKEFRSNLEPIFEKRFQMTPEERRVLDLEEEIALRDKVESRRTQSQKEESSRQEYITKIESMREEAGLSKEEFVKIYDELAKSNLVAKEKLTPEVVVNYHKELSARQALASTITEVNPSIDESELNDAVNILREHWINHPELTIEDIKEAAIEAWGDKRSKVLSRKLSKSEPTKNYKPERSRDNTPLSFDDI